MRIYWWFMAGLMLFPWILALVPAGVTAYRGSPPRRTDADTCDGFELSPGQRSA